MLISAQISSSLYAYHTATNSDTFSVKSGATEPLPTLEDKLATRLSISNSTYFPCFTLKLE